MPNPKRNMAFRKSAYYRRQGPFPSPYKPFQWVRPVGASSLTAPANLKKEDWRELDNAILSVARKHLKQWAEQDAQRPLKKEN